MMVKTCEGSKRQAKVFGASESLKERVWRIFDASLADMTGGALQEVGPSLSHARELLIRSTGSTADRAQIWCGASRALRSSGGSSTRSEQCMLQTRCAIAPRSARARTQSVLFGNCGGPVRMSFQRARCTAFFWRAHRSVTLQQMAPWAQWKGVRQQFHRGLCITRVLTAVVLRSTGQHLGMSICRSLKVGEPRAQAILTLLSGGIDFLQFALELRQTVAKSSKLTPK
mmetsp:Transcript_102414/g.187018  ORF Transcript_102414/g.187018 Transcript_102414/m.187018 type:complete len:228 (-) Transcript_102414:143-826(-)